MRNKRTFNITLATACLKTGQSYTEVARHAGISRETLSKLIHGGGVPCLLTIQRLADGLGVPVTELGFFTPSPSGHGVHGQATQPTIKEGAE